MPAWSRMDLHRIGEQRSLAYHRVVADRLPGRPEAIAEARARVHAALEASGGDAPYARRWLSLLDGPLEALLAVLRDPGPDAAALRSCSPFAGFLEPRERWRLWREVRERVERGAAE